MGARIVEQAYMKNERKGGGGSDDVALSRVLQGNGDGNFDYL